MNTSSCRSCGAPIWWASEKFDSPEEVEAKKGEHTIKPIDAEPRDDGNVLLWQRGGSLVFKVMTNKGMEEALEKDPDRKRYVSHFVTCPNANKHRKKKK